MVKVKLSRHPLRQIETIANFAAAKGDADYGYILRENQIKDYIYYRYASIYEGVDKDKAKQIANQALQFVDDRFTYYPNIIAVLEG